MSDRVRGGGCALRRDLDSGVDGVLLQGPAARNDGKGQLPESIEIQKEKERRRSHLVDQMARRLNQPQQLGHIPTPPVQNLVACLLLGKIHHSGRSVDSRVDRLVYYERGEGRLGLSQRQVEQGRKSVERDARVVARNSPNVLRDQQTTLRRGVRTYRLWASEKDKGSAGGGGTYVLNHPLVQLFPPERPLLTLVKHRRLAQSRSVQALNCRPPLQFRRGERLEQVAVTRKGKATGVSLSGEEGEGAAEERTGAGKPSSSPGPSRACAACPTAHCRKEPTRHSWRSSREP